MGISDFLFWLMVVISAITLLFGVIIPIIRPYEIYSKISRYFEFRNKCLKDYPELYTDMGFFRASLDGILDYKFISKIERSAWRKETPEHYLFFLSPMASEWKREIEDRYYGKAMQNVYKRASRILLHYEKQRAYFAFDEETDSQFQLASAIAEHQCLICEDTKIVYGPFSSCRTEVPCECCKSSVAIHI